MPFDRPARGVGLGITAFLWIASSGVSNYVPQQSDTNICHIHIFVTRNGTAHLRRRASAPYRTGQTRDDSFPRVVTIEERYGARRAARGQDGNSRSGSEIYRVLDQDTVDISNQTGNAQSSLGT